MTADRVELSAQARADLDDLLEYLLERNPVAARQILAAIDEVIATLATPSPRVEGRPVTLKSGATCRRWFVHPVVIFSQRAPRVVFIQTEVVDAGLPPRRRSVIGSGEPVTRGALRVRPPVGTLFIRTYNTAAMIKKLSAVGNSLGLIIERPILELLNITKDTALEIKTDGEALIIRPVQLTKRERVRESTRRMMSVHDETLQKLAK